MQRGVRTCTRATGKLVTEMLRFGTDGVRGRVGVDIDETQVARLGAAVARVWPHHAMVIGNDGRESGAGWTRAFAQGAQSQGTSVTSAGVVPTPAIARTAAERGCVGIAITASHNAWHDNGVKVFAPGGRKLTDDEQQRIEALWQESSEATGGTSVMSDGASVVNDDSCARQYIAAITQMFADASDAGARSGMAVQIDAANGATSHVIAPIMTALGLRAAVHHAAPNGRNINDGCGAVHPESLAAACTQHGEIGLAFDGDGDRVIAVDELGNVVDGDRLIALMALDLRARRRLRHDTVVVTSMTNLGFHRAMQQHGISVVTTDVGDRAVLAAMDEGGFVLGGEQSGHIIHSSDATTGDGILASLHLLRIVRESGKTLAELAANVMQRMPQLLRNVRVTTKPTDVEALLGEDLARERAALGDDGRIVVRASGTEPLVRIMVEAPTLMVAEAVADRLAQLVTTRS